VLPTILGARPAMAAGFTVRDTKDQARRPHVHTAGEGAFLARVRAGEFDRPG
jgi:hypothetical protein